jgi:hypothetical protein
MNQLKNKFSKPIAEIKVFLKKALGKSDYERWGNQENLLPNWDLRTQQIANLIEAGSSVIEFGAAKMVLRNFLPDKCSYTPSDLVDRGDGTIICDLNSKTLPEFGQYDVAVFSGVLEYIHDVPRLIEHLSNSVNTITTSYAVIETNPNKEKRYALGWVNNYSSEQLVEIFVKAGFQCSHSEKFESDMIKSQMIYKFTKKTEN